MNAYQSDYEQGMAAGKRYALDARKQNRRAVGPDGKEHDLLDLAAGDDDVYLPDDAIAQVNGRVPEEAQPAYITGFRDGVRAFLSGQHLGMGDN